MTVINKDISIRVCIILGLMYFFNLTLLSQNIENPDDSLLTPKVFLQDGYIQSENFPAISKDGKKIMLIHSDYSCCISTQEEFRVIKPKGATIQNKIILAPQEDLPDFSQNQKLKIIEEIDSILIKETYYPLIAIDSFSVQKNTSSSKNYINIIYNGVKFKTDKFKLNKMKQSGYCCTAEVNDPPCMQMPNVQEVWMDEKGKFLLIVYGINYGPDGCEAGPEYTIVGLK